MGRSRGGLTTKIHAVVDANGMPITLKLSEGQAHDGNSAADMLETLGDDQILLADAAYDSDALRATVSARGAWANIKPMPQRKSAPVFSSFLYRHMISNIEHQRMKVFSKLFPQACGIFLFSYAPIYLIFRPNKLFS